MKSIHIKLFCLLVASNLALAQFSEFGGGIGVSNARTDIGAINPANTRYGANLFYRMNLSHIWVARTEVKYVNFASADNSYSDLISKKRNYSFSNNAIEASLSMEFNFLNYRFPKDEHRWCPFLTAGLANFTTFNSSSGGVSPFNIALPFGFGVKYKLGDYWNLGFIYTASKTFNDKLDNVTNNSPYPNSSKLSGNDNSINDWYHYAGFTISYTLYKLKCPKHLEGETAPEYWQRQFR